MAGAPIAAAADSDVPVARTLPLAARFTRPRLWWLVIPTLALFVIFFIVPVASLFAISLNKNVPGSVTLHGDFVLTNFVRIFTRPLYYDSIINSLEISAAVALLALLLGYPLAFLIAKTEHPGRNTLLMILVLSSMQLDTVIRLYGMMVLLGDNGLINGALKWAGLISHPLPLMYNVFGVIVGLVQITLPFMVLSLIGVIRNVHPSLEEAARSLGASRWSAFRFIILPLSVPGILAGTLLVFALSISSYVVPALMGGWKVQVMPIHIYQQISEMGRWQFGAAIAVVLFAASMIAVFIYDRVAVRTGGGLT
jgi:putative spermidine/putrescine transport system permease protein